MRGKNIQAKIILLILSLFLLTQSAVFSQEVNYPLPYPGILPDHPLYAVKAARDKIYQTLLSDQLKKAQFELLTADKRLNMGIMLVNKQNYKLAQQTLSKSSKYFEQSVLSMQKAKQKGMETGSFRDRLLLSSQKHQEILSAMQKTDIDILKTGLVEPLALIAHYEQELVKNAN